MTSDERQMLLDLARKISATPPAQRDAEAEDLIRTQIGSRPDALYLMTQTVLIQNLALEQANRRIRELEQRTSPDEPQAGGSFLGGLFGGGARNVPPPQTAQPQPGFLGGGGSGFLRGAAQTAAGVAAGALAFEGIRSLLGGGFGHFGSNEASGFLGGMPAGEHRGEQEEAQDSSYDEETETPAEDDTSYEDSDFPDDGGGGDDNFI